MIMEHAVRERAYFIWENEGRLAGRAETHWLQAEAELSAGSGPMIVAAVETVRAPSPTKTLKPAAKKTKPPAKCVEAVAPKQKRPSRAKAEHAAVH